MFKLFNKSKIEEEKITHCLSLFWDPSEKFVSFWPFFSLAQIYDVEITNMTFTPNVCGADNRNMAKFEVTGTYTNLENFERYIPLLENMSQFKHKY